MIQERIAVVDPFSGRLVGEVPVMGRAAVQSALDDAAAFRYELDRHERSTLLFAVAERIGDEEDRLAALISSESGLCLRDTRHEVQRGRDVFRAAAIEALRDDGEAFACDTSAVGRRRRAITHREPVGMAAAITPFNHPLNQVAHKVAPAIAAGTPIVLKPSERTPLTALWLLDALAECGLPHDAVQLVTGDPSEIGAAMLEHPAVEVVLFTGSVGVGKSIAANLGYRRAVLELGGNDPLLVLDGARIERAAELAVTGAFANSGQRCTAVKRIIALDSLADELAQAVAQRAALLVAGDPLDERTDVGTVISEAAAVEIEQRIRDAVDSGARLLAGGDRRGAQIEPCVLDRVRPEMPVVALETFGPVAPILRVRDADEAIALANATPYGLSAGVVTADLELALRCARELRCGSVNIDEVPGFRTELTPFGGIGDSGLGVKEGVRETIRALTVGKLVSFPW
ncbi:MAG: aldehyde dehydrogenase family protein [Actinomycetota bacterium]|nr:aldehyde dehydrogenase family protein [Actinomycetota bacterium]